MSITNSTITSADILRIATQSLFPKPNFGHSFDVRTVDPVAQSVRRLVDVLCHDHSSDWTQIAADLGVSKRLAGILSYPQTDDQMNDALDVLEKSATFVLDQRKLNWGRVVAVLGLYVEMCRGWSRQVKIDPFQSNKLRHFVENRLAEAFGNFLDSYIGDWVLAHGGWIRLASIRSTTEPAMSSCVVDLKTGIFNYISYAVMGMGIGALLGLMVVR